MSNLDHDMAYFLELERKLNSITTYMSNINSCLNRFFYEKNLEDILTSGLTHVRKKAIKNTRKYLYKCKTSYFESADEVLDSMTEFNDLYRKAMKLDISTKDVKYLHELFKLYSLALYRIAVMGGI